MPLIEVDFNPTESSIKDESSVVDEKSSVHIPKVDESSIVTESISFDEASLYKLTFPAEYHEMAGTDQMVDEVFSPDGKVVRYFSSGRKEISFPSGVKRESFPDGYMCIKFENQDVRQHFPDGKVVYFFYEQGIT